MFRISDALRCSSSAEGLQDLCKVLQTLQRLKTLCLNRLTDFFAFADLAELQPLTPIALAPSPLLAAWRL